ncbi:hypothetical protein [Vibrio sp. D431a]|uniref:hypothetical protein n=1 Tax=Vibrio sp. D431a TaxID=2837388 RepID=UPI002555CD2F|nr:hypothetical protein [Vibrio sp. D431a]MDK9790629.1 hypothetical protein [Vibrio sp. D431a]
MRDNTHYIRYNAVYLCGCVFTSDSWYQQGMSATRCPSHHKERVMEMDEKVIGERTDSKEIILKPIKVPLETIRRLV